MLQDKESLCSFYCEPQRSLDRMIQVICFKYFWTNVSKFAGESMIKNLSQLRTVKFLGLVSVKQNDSSYLFQAFLNECEQACRGVHDKEFEPTEACEISRPGVSETDNLNHSV